MTSDHDVIIVGAGLAGGILAGVLAEGGRRVLLLERGRALAENLRDPAQLDQCLARGGITGHCAARRRPVAAPKHRWRARRR